jgi:hypothetical protein
MWTVQSGRLSTKTTRTEPGKWGFMFLESRKQQSIVAVKTAVCPGMAGGTLLIYPDKQGVSITIKAHFVDVLRIARGLTLDPELPSTARIKSATTCRKCQSQSLVIHPCHHQHFGSFVINYDRTD